MIYSYKLDENGNIEFFDYNGIRLTPDEFYNILRQKNVIPVKIKNREERDEEKRKFNDKIY